MFRHLKSGRLYHKVGVAIDATNATEGRTMVIYCREDDPRAFFVREHEEFMKKFERVDVC